MVLALLLLDETHPRSVAYQLHELSNHVNELPRTVGKSQLSEQARLLLKAYTDLRLCNISELSQLNENDGIYTALDQLLANTTDLLWRFADVIAEAYFSHAQTSQLMVANTTEDEL